MRIFLSHSSRQKPLVREVQNHFPKHIKTWIDEREILIGDELEPILENIINFETDYVLLFFDESAASSEWVRKEIDWTIAAEKSARRTILLTVLIDDSAFAREKCDKIINRKYIRISDFSERSVAAAASTIVSELFAMVCRDLYQLALIRTHGPISGDRWT